jgi:5-methylcytosine-specific restriction endonuclease McrA
MPFKDANYNRDYQREWSTKRREEKRLLSTDDPTTDPLITLGERWIAKWLRQGEKLLANHSDEAVASRIARNRAKVRRHKAKFPDRVLASAKKTYQKHQVKRRQQAKQRYEAHREEENARARAYYAEHTEEIATQKQAYRLENQEKRALQHALWASKHPERIVSYSAQRRARKAHAPLNDLTADQWLEIQAVYGYRCVYCPPNCKACRKKTHRLTQDHITPLSKNGPNTSTNIVPACQSCNARKHNKAPLRPVQPLLLTVAPSRPPPPP